MAVEIKGIVFHEICPVGRLSIKADSFSCILVVNRVGFVPLSY